MIPTSKVDPEPRAHDGHEWFYVLSGQVRLALGDKDGVLGPGEIAEFDTQVPPGSAAQAKYLPKSSASSVDPGSG